jgi:hypothetical protein
MFMVVALKMNMVAHTCNSRVLGCWDWENHSLRLIRTKSFRDLQSNQCQDMMVHAVIPAMQEAEMDTTMVPGQSGQNVCENPSQQKKLNMGACLSSQLQQEA